MEDRSKLKRYYCHRLINQEDNGDGDKGDLQWRVPKAVPVCLSFFVFLVDGCVCPVWQRTESVAIDAVLSSGHSRQCMKREPSQGSSKVPSAILCRCNTMQLAAVQAQTSCITMYIDPMLSCHEMCESLYCLLSSVGSWGSTTPTFFHPSSIPSPTSAYRQP